MKCKDCKFFKIIDGPIGRCPGFVEGLVRNKEANCYFEPFKSAQPKKIKLYEI